MDEKESILASVPAELKEKGSLLHASLIDGKVLLKDCNFGILVEGLNFSEFHLSKLIWIKFQSEIHLGNDVAL